MQAEQFPSPPQPQDWAHNFDLGCFLATVIGVTDLAMSINQATPNTACDLSVEKSGKLIFPLRLLSWKSKGLGPCCKSLFNNGEGKIFDTIVSSLDSYFPITKSALVLSQLCD